MIGCGTSAEDKTKIQNLETMTKTVDGAVKTHGADIVALKDKIAQIEKFLGDKTSKFGAYGVPADTGKKAPAVEKKGKVEPKKEEPKKEEKKTEPKTPPTKTK
jgi:ribosomal protein L12E/L44/L45/RPP1/RPP2